MANPFRKKGDDDKDKEGQRPATPRTAPFLSDDDDRFGQPSRGGPFGGRGGGDKGRDEDKGGPRRFLPGGGRGDDKGKADDRGGSRGGLLGGRGGGDKGRDEDKSGSRRFLPGGGRGDDKGKGDDRGGSRGGLLGGRGGGDKGRDEDKSGSRRFLPGGGRGDDKGKADDRGGSRGGLLGGRGGGDKDKDKAQGSGRGGIFGRGKPEDRPESRSDARPTSRAPFSSGGSADDDPLRRRTGYGPSENRPTSGGPMGSPRTPTGDRLGGTTPGSGTGYPARRTFDPDADDRAQPGGLSRTPGMTGDRSQFSRPAGGGLPGDRGGMMRTAAGDRDEDEDDLPRTGSRLGPGSPLDRSPSNRPYGTTPAGDRGRDLPGSPRSASQTGFRERPGSPSPRSPVGIGSPAPEKKEEERRSSKIPFLGGRDKDKGEGRKSQTGERPAQPVGRSASSEAFPRRDAAPRPVSPTPSPRTPSKPAPLPEPRGKGKQQDKQARTAARSTARARALPDDKGTSGGLDFDRKLDLVGVALVVLGGIVLFGVLPSVSFGLLPPVEGGLTGTINLFLSQLFGWGKLIWPVVLFAIGIWLMVTYFGGQMFELNYFRLIGALLLYLCVLTWIQMLQLVNDPAPTVEAFRPISYALAIDEGQGGGWFGHQAYLFLLGQLGDWGTVVSLIGWLVLGLMLTFDVSVVELGQFVAKAFVVVGVGGRAWNQRRAARKIAHTQEIEIVRPGEQPASAGARQMTLTGAAAAVDTPAAPKPAAPAAPANPDEPPHRPMPLIRRRAGNGDSDEPDADKLGAAAGLALAASAASGDRADDSKPSRPRLPHFRRGKADDEKPGPETASPATSAPVETSASSGESEQAPAGQTGRFGGKLGGLLRRKGDADAPTEQTAAPAEPSGTPGIPVAPSKARLSNPLARPKPAGETEAPKSPDVTPEPEHNPARTPFARSRPGLNPAARDESARDESVREMPAVVPPRRDPTPTPEAERHEDRADRPGFLGRRPEEPKPAPDQPEQPGQTERPRPFERSLDRTPGRPERRFEQPQRTLPGSPSAPGDQPASSRDRPDRNGDDDPDAVGGPAPAPQRDRAALAGGILGARLLGNRGERTPPGADDRPRPVHDDDTDDEDTTPTPVDDLDDEPEEKPVEKPALRPVPGARLSLDRKSGRDLDEGDLDDDDLDLDDEDDGDDEPDLALRPARPALTPPGPSRPGSTLRTNPAVPSRPGLSINPPRPQDTAAPPASEQQPAVSPRPDGSAPGEHVPPGPTRTGAPNPTPDAEHPAAASVERPATPQRTLPNSNPVPPRDPARQTQVSDAPAAASTPPTSARPAASTTPPAPPIQRPASPTPATPPPRATQTPPPAPQPAPAASGEHAAPAKRKGFEVPDFRKLLRQGSEQRINDEILLEKARVIEDTLASFGAPGKVVEVNPGPVITQFGVEPDYLVARSGKKTRVKVGSIARLDADLALALAARSIRIEAPVPGKGFVGIEVPNDEVTLVSLHDIMDSPEFRRIDSKLRIALGLGVDGTPVAADLTAMPHLLIAGTTGSGKSVCVNTIINCLLLSNTPDDVQFIMVDPKRVELTGYNGIPHLVAPVVVDLERIVGVLQWVQREMEERYRKFASRTARNILDYNNKLAPGEKKLPYYVVVVDELADLMMLAPDETERLLARLAQMARATGIHLIISTQRPSVDIITGLIKANFPARIAFAVASSVDSRVILDQPGAEKLLGRGDMLYLSPDAAAPLRMQGVYVSDEEINQITRYWKGLMLDSTGSGSEDSPLASPSREVTFNAMSFGPGRSKSNTPAARATESAQQAFWDDNGSVNLSDDDDIGSGEDELYEEAVELVQRLNKASISLLQRRLRIGYTRAARLIDLMEQEGIVGPAESGSKPREVLKGRLT